MASGKKITKPPFMIKQKVSSSFNVSNDANGNTSINIYEEGYLPIAILTLTGSGNSQVCYSDFYLDGSGDSTTFKFYFHNYKGSAVSGMQCAGRILYVSKEYLYDAQLGLHESPT